jgi:hypothetical protein
MIGERIAPDAVRDDPKRTSGFGLPVNVRNWRVAEIHAWGPAVFRVQTKSAPALPGTYQDALLINVPRP